MYLHPRNDHRLANYTFTDVYPDHWFFIFRQKGLYRIRSEFTDEALYFNRDTAGSFDWNAVYPDQFFRFEPGSGAKAGTFRIICPNTSTVLFSPNETDREVGICDADAVYDDQDFFFVPEGVATDSNEYIINTRTFTQVTTHTSEVRLHTTTETTHDTV